MENFNFSLFNNIEKDDYTNMLKCFTYRRKAFEAGETICDYTMQHKQIGIVEEGTVLMVKIDYDGTRTIVEALEKGEIFGEAMAFSQSVEDSVFAESETKTTIMFIDYDHITKRCTNACVHHSQLVYNLFFIMSNKLVTINKRLEVLTNRSIRDKLLCYFNILALKKKSRDFEIPFSVTTLAEYICTDRSAMMREIKAMKNEGLIEMNKRSVRLLM